MGQVKYSEELVQQVLSELESTGDVHLVSRKFGVPVHSIYRFRRQKLKTPEALKDKKIKELSKELADQKLENKILRELLKKTYQVLPIELD